MDNSLISNLGFVPPDSTFKIAEVHNTEKIETICTTHPYFEDCKIISSSDAHYLPDINEAKNYLEIDSFNPKKIINYLRNIK